MSHRFQTLGSAFLVIACTVASSALAADRPAGLDQTGKPALKSAGPLAFGPEGVLFVGDPRSAALFAIGIEPSGPASSSETVRLEGVNVQLAALVGIQADELLINDVAVQPDSTVVYLSASRGRGPDAEPVLARLTPAGKLTLLSLDNVPYAKVDLNNAPGPDEVDKRGNKLRQESITDLQYVDGRVFVAGLSNEEFASKLRAISFPFEGTDPGAGVEIYHGAHGRFETRAPVRTFVPFNVHGEPHLLAAYTCTPLVTFPVSELKAGAKLRGTTVAELGNHNRPLDIIAYEKDGRTFLLLANSARGVMKIATDDLDEQPSISQPVKGTAGLKYDTIEALKGVEHLDKLGNAHAVLLVRSDAGALNLETISLPQAHGLVLLADPDPAPRRARQLSASCGHCGLAIFEGRVRMSLARRSFSLLGVCYVLASCGWLMAAEPAAVAPTIHELKNADGQILAIEASPLPAMELTRLSQRVDSNEALARVLSVSVDGASAGQPAIAGSYAVHQQTLRFTPQFAFRAGQAYRAVLHWSKLQPAAAIAASDVIYPFRAPAHDLSPLAEVTAIFPSTASIPENQLRFYIHFSAPMSRGAAYDHVRLLDSRQQSINLPFLELGEELWDPQQRRLTLLIDPGRIKRGVLPREELGTVFHVGEQFTLVVQASWLDAQNRPLRKEFAKHFRVGPPIEEAIDPAQWQIRAPAPGSREPLTIDFPRSLDHALLERMIAVRSAAGKRIEGQVLVSHDEQRWELRPTLPWPSGKFEVVVDRALEDLAGNRIGRAFEVDQAGPITQQVQTDVVHLPFEVGAQH